MSTTTPPSSEALFISDLSLLLRNNYAAEAHALPMPFNPKPVGKDASDLRYYVTEAFIKHVRAICINKMFVKAYNSNDKKLEADTLCDASHYVENDARDAVENLVTEGGLLFFHMGITSDAQLAQIDDYAAIAAQYNANSVLQGVVA